MCDSLIVLQEHVIVEAIFDGGTIAEAATIYFFHGFTQDMSTGVPVNLYNMKIYCLISKITVESFLKNVNYNCARRKKITVLNVCDITLNRSLYSYN